MENRSDTRGSEELDKEATWNGDSDWAPLCTRYYAKGIIHTLSFAHYSLCGGICYCPHFTDEDTEVP
jgi:hypothetical protein